MRRFRPQEAMLRQTPLKLRVFQQKASPRTYVPPSPQQAGSRHVMCAPDQPLPYTVIHTPIYMYTYGNTHLKVADHDLYRISEEVHPPNIGERLRHLREKTVAFKRYHGSTGAGQGREGQGRAGKGGGGERGTAAPQPQTAKLSSHPAGHKTASPPKRSRSRATKRRETRYPPRGERLSPLAKK